MKTRDDAVRLPVIVTNGASLKCPPVARALKAAGMEVHIGERFKRAPTFYSRACDGSFVYPPPEKFPEEFVGALGQYAEKFDCRAIFPLNIPETLALAKNQALLPGSVKLPFGDYDTMLRLHTKHEVIKLAESLGISVPRTLLCTYPSDLPRMGREIGFPLVMKPAQSSSSQGVSFHSNQESLKKAFLELQKQGRVTDTSPALIQEKISGPGCGTSVLMNRGKAVAAVSHLRLHEYPPSGGPSTYRMSISNQKMENIAVGLLETAGWHGLAMVEFKLDSRTGNPVLIEVNPRVWGSIYQSIAAGVNFPSMAIRLALGEDMTGFQRGRAGVRTMCLLNEMRLIFFSALHFRVEAVKIIGDVLKAPFFRVKTDIFSISDPLPFFIFGAMGMGLFPSGEGK